MKKFALPICILLAFRLCFSQNFPSMPQVSAPTLSSPLEKPSPANEKKSPQKTQSADLISEILSLLAGSVDGGYDENYAAARAVGLLRDSDFSQDAKGAQSHIVRFKIDGKDLRSLCCGFFSAGPSSSGEFAIACDFFSGLSDSRSRETFFASFSSKEGDGNFSAECGAFCTDGALLAKFRKNKILAAKRTGKIFAIRDDELKVDIVVRVE